MSTAKISREAQINEREARVKEIISSDLTEAEKIDAIVSAKRWFRGQDAEEKVIQSFRRGDLALGELVERLCKDVERLYTSANEGRALIKAELVCHHINIFDLFCQKNVFIVFCVSDHHSHI